MDTVLGGIDQVDPWNITETVSVITGNAKTFHALPDQKWIFYNCLQFETFIYITMFKIAKSCKKYI